MANQASLFLAYKASLTLLHPPLLVLILYFWRGVGTSNLVLRLPCVIAGTLFCWVLWKWLTVVAGRTAGWVGLILVTFLPPMIALSADLRQYTLMLLFATCAAYFLERALAENSVRLVAISTAFLYLALLSHYSAFLFAMALGVYCILRMFAHPPSAPVIAAWAAGQVGGLGLGWILYTTQIAELRKVYPGAQPLHRYADWYLSDYYFHAGRNQLLPFLYHGTFGVFRFIFGRPRLEAIAALMFAAGTLLLLFEKPAAKTIDYLARHRSFPAAAVFFELCGRDCRTISLRANPAMRLSRYFRHRRGERFPGQSHTTARPKRGPTGRRYRHPVSRLRNSPRARYAAAGRSKA